MASINVFGSGVVNVTGTGSANVFPIPTLNLYTWGSSSSGGNSTGVDISNKSGNFVNAANAYAFKNTDGSVQAWGSSTNGGDTSGVSSALDGTNPVTTIYSSNFASFFAAKHVDNTITTWGNSATGGDSSAPVNGTLTDIIDVYCCSEGGIALKEDNITPGEYSVVTWGASTLTNNFPTASLSSGIKSVVVNSSAFAFLKGTAGNYSVVTIGHPYRGGQSDMLSPSGASISSGVVKVVGYDKSKFTGTFLALKSDGSVVAWGKRGSTEFNQTGGDVTSPVNASSQLTSGVVDIGVSLNFCYALKGSPGNYSVVTWGGGNTDPSTSFPGEYGGDSSSLTPSGENLTSGVVSVVVNNFCGCALKSDGNGAYKVITWGSVLRGGDQKIRDTDNTTVVYDVSSQLTSGVVQVVATAAAFSALKNDGTVICWGFRSHTDKTDVGGYKSGTLTDIESIYSNGVAFLGVKTDGSVVTWGSSSGGGNSDSVQPLTNSEEIAFTTNSMAVTTYD